MDVRLIASARAVKARDRPIFPVLWLFTDAARLPDPLPAARALPRGAAGVVFRPEGLVDPLGLARDLARICRDRRLILLVAGNPRLAARLGAGLHLRAGRRAGPRARHGLTSSSAHDKAELIRARRAGADLAFLSPAFATSSHPGARPLGALRWVALARSAGLPVLALGGVTGANFHRLRPVARGMAAIAALAPTGPL